MELTNILEYQNLKKNQNEKMKPKAWQYYYKIFQKVLKSNLSGGSTVKVINAWPAAALKYTAGTCMVDWTAEDLKAID